MSASSTTLDFVSQALAAKIKAKAHELGFDLVGVASAEPPQRGEYFRRWLDEGQAGTMHYLADRFEERTHPAAYLGGAQSVVCVAMNYHAHLEPTSLEQQSHQGRIARYALGDDYHEIIKDRLYDLADWIRETVPGARTRCGVDTVPVMEKELAARAGIGWVGKNTCVINPRLGSWLLLGEVLTTIPLPADEPAADHCGSCTRCLDACPTGAITAPYQLDARRCISYLTIEHRGEIAGEFKPQIGDWLYGCDVCQDVCPHNRQAPVAADPALQPRFPTGVLDVRDVMNWDEDAYRANLRHSAMKRVKLPVLQRNAAIVAENLRARHS
ncbi:MAG: 4Fe-4S ferredoxin, iron-sulfur binding protein [Phycisphaerales bacterium]|nr:4Fe-4S ferredoxin, iron-sulfur binding protein [Phycisphaerales bacterium]